MTAYLSRPRSGQHPGIMVIHEVWGLNEQIKGVVRRYAEQGFVALAPHLYTRFGDTVCLQCGNRRIMQPSNR